VGIIDCTSRRVHRDSNGQLSGGPRNFIAKAAKLCSFAIIPMQPGISLKTRTKAQNENSNGEEASGPEAIFQIEPRVSVEA
jgi:hypothetical protein